jgi:hypothetical protein
MLFFHLVYAVILTLVAVTLLAVLVYREKYRPLSQKQEQIAHKSDKNDMTEEESPETRAAVMILERPPQRAPKSIFLGYRHQKKHRQGFQKRRHVRATAKHPPALRTTCKTNIPACLLKRKDVVEFSEEFDVELYYNSLMRTIRMLVCHVSVVLSPIY